MKHCVLSKSKRVHTYQAKSNSQYSYYVKTRLVNNAVLSRSSFNLFELRSLQSCNRTDQKNYRRYDETMELSVVLPVCRASTSILGERKSRSLSNNASIFISAQCDNDASECLAQPTLRTSIVAIHATEFVSPCLGIDAVFLAFTIYNLDLTPSNRNLTSLSALVDGLHSSNRLINSVISPYSSVRT